MGWYRYGYRTFKLYIILAVIIFLVLSIPAYIFSTSSLPDLYLPPGSDMPDGIHLAVEIDSLNLPKEMMVYKFLQAPMSKGDVEKLAEKLNINNSVIYDKKHQEWLVCAGGKMLLVERNSGIWTFQDTTAHYNSFFVNSFPISDNDVIQLARDYLNGIGIDTGQFSSAAVGTTTENGRVIQKSVYFYQQLDGFEVLGASRLVVDIGSQRQIKGIIKHCQKFETYKTCKLKSLQQAVAEINRGQAQFHIPELPAGEAAVTEIRLAYYGEAQHAYLQPVYVFSGEVETREGPQPFSAILPAVRGVNIKWE
ncbi:hypothetical protein JOC37_000824 [Desulfohalotomaculum tongense]|uniref:hypothetical protein n=1 Tax=Desulforadius tongensis TaxID=1216062 RepID=UPI00195B58E4|nr:hypothetical protein [Desulforadius tongensis]MBM7854451.1 hypothetical protein [Desulforadius tongensis]